MVRATVGSSGSTTAKINSPTSTGPQTVSVTVPSGTQLQNSALSLKLLGDVNATNLSDGALIQYDSETEKFVTRNELETTSGTITFNGGSF